MGGCSSRAPIQLTTQEPPELAWGSLDIDAQARLDRNGTGTLDLAVDLSIRHMGTQAARLDLASAMLQVDGLPWERCQSPFEFNSDRLLINLAAEELTSLTLLCLEIPRPQQSLVLRFNASGTGSSSPVIDIPFSGMRKR